jgi:hypothetical protein
MDKSLFQRKLQKINSKQNRIILWFNQLHPAGIILALIPLVIIIFLSPAIIYRVAGKTKIDPVDFSKESIKAAVEIFKVWGGIFIGTFLLGFMKDNKEIKDLSKNAYKGKICSQNLIETLKMTDAILDLKDWGEYQNWNNAIKYYLSELLEVYEFMNANRETDPIGRNTYAPRLLTSATFQNNIKAFLERVVEGEVIIPDGIISSEDKEKLKICLNHLQDLEILFSKKPSRYRLN